MNDVINARKRVMISVRNELVDKPKKKFNGFICFQAGVKHDPIKSMIKKNQRCREVEICGMQCYTYSKDGKVEEKFNAKWTLLQFEKRSQR